MKKRLLAFFLSALMIASLVGCSGGSSNEEAEKESKEEVAEEVEEVADEADSAAEDIFAVMVLPNVSEVVYSDWAKAAQEKFDEAGIKYEVAACDDDVNIMNQQIENYVVMGCTHIFCQQISADAQAGSLAYAVEQGVDVLVVNEVDDETSYTSRVSVAQYDMGDNMAKMAAEWIEETFPDAEDGSIDVATFGTYAFDHVLPRTEAFENITKYTSKANVVEYYDYGASTSPNKDAQDWIENLLVKYPDVKCILGQAGTVVEMNEIVMADDNIDKATFAMFTDTESDVMYELIEASANNESVVRGLCTFSSIGEMFFNYVTNPDAMNIEGELVWTDLFICDAENVNEYK